jgi:ferric-dicitrate binding protein FerR (iron transport regulator)
MSDQQLLRLLERYLCNECTAEEKDALESWYNGFQSRHALEAPDAAPRLELIYQGMVEQLRQEGEWQEAPVRRMRGRWWQAAAAVLLVALAGGAWLLFRPAPTVTALTQAGQRTRLTLPDGTAVWLNVSSRLEYGKSMRKGAREVYLQGEAYFEVEQQAGRPFVIHTRDVNVQVLGTTFNLRAYPEDSTLETTLVEGKVAVNLNAAAKRRLLEPGQKLTLTRKPAGAATVGGQEDWGLFSAEVERVEHNAADSSMSETNWRNDRLQFKNKSFSELATIMERWYNKRIVIRDPSLNDNRFAGEFRNEDITQALRALQLTADFTYEIKGDTVYIQH